MSGGFAVVPAAYVLLLRGDRVLLQLRQNTGFMDGHWACAAAGHVEAGESVVQAAVREAMEEIGVSIAPEALTPLSTLHRTNGGNRQLDQRVDFFFSCDLWEGEPGILEPEKCADLQWFSLADLPDPMPPHERYVLEGLRKGTLAPIASLGFNG
ncbi:NUDIX domain-containing protein [Paeniglutamicibacter sp. NPDC091659]|uniref:NUDIX hydrolase n=1 Tax=Paeniglutamicibacter sp. NPDC091659 TaxID=3364389 RepID=UPI0037FB5B3D